MSIADETRLLIQSKFPLIFFESADEKYSLNQLKSIASQLGLIFYDWAVTVGLRRQDSEGPYYQTLEPVKMLKTIETLLDSDSLKSGLFVLRDFEKFLEDVVLLRLFKDVLNRVRPKRDTIIILSPQYKIPKDIETDTAHIIGGYPDEEEMKALISEVLKDLSRYNKKIKVDLSKEEANKIVIALKGLTRQQVRNVITQSVLNDNFLNAEDIKTIEEYKRKVFDQDGVLEFCSSEVKSNIAGFHNLKRWLEERSSSFDSCAVSESLFDLNGSSGSPLPPPKGIILMGVQGCGKSLAVKVAASELKILLYRLDIGRLYGSYIGETEQNLRKALSIVERLSPMCLWIDEIEKAFAGSSSSREDGGVSRRVLGLFLTWMQERKAKCFIAATANDVYSLPPEFLRKGRFDESFFVDLPDEPTRKRLFEIHLSKRGLEPEKLNAALLAQKAVGFSGAEIEQAVISALYRANSVKKDIASEHILEQLSLTKPLAVLKAEEIEHLRAWMNERAVSV